MDKQKILTNSFFIFLISFMIIFQIIPKVKSTLSCTPDYKSIGDNYSSVNDPQDNSEYLYGRRRIL